MEALENLALGIETMPSVETNEKILNISEKISLGSLLPVYLGSWMVFFDSVEKFGYGLMGLGGAIFYGSIKQHLRAHDQLEEQGYFEN